MCRRQSRAFGGEIAKRNLETFIVTQQTVAVPIMPITPFIREGELAHEIIRAAEENQVDLLVIATHGYSGWKKFLPGSVTERLIRIALMPVLTICSPED